MTWLAARLFFSGALKRLWGIVSHASLWQIVSGVLAIVAIVQHFELSRSRAEAAKWHKQFDAEHSGRIADRKTYQQAQTDAAALNKEQVAKVEQQYQRNSDDEKQSYLSDLAKLRADRVRRQGATPQGSAGTAGSPPASAPATGADADGLCVPAESAVCEAAAEIELRLLHLQNLYDKQTTLDPNAK